MNRAIFLDRDGTLIEEANYLSRPEQVKWIPGVPQNLAKLACEGWLLIVVTNQSGVGRGYFTMDDVNNVHEHMQKELARYGAKFTAMYCCPHSPADNCLCRKPQATMYSQAQRDWNLDLSHCVAFGDKLADLQGPIKLGCRAFLVKTGYGREEIYPDIKRDYPKLEFCTDLAEGCLSLLENKE
ncbi:HAD family hydrolase [bacterium]|nr:HAD family hydrolase [bacterium]